MRSKTKKLMWAVPLIAVVAAIGALAIFMAPEPGNVFANPLPAAPTNLTVKAAEGDAGRTTLVLSWTAPAGGNVTGYRIDKSNVGGIWETLEMNTGSTATTYTDTLTAEDTRWYRVFAVNDHREVGPVSNAASGTTKDKVSPGPVMTLRAVPNAKNPRKRLDLSWDAPDETGGEMIVGYEIQAHVAGGWQAVVTDSAATANGTVVTKTSYMDPTDRDPGDTQRYRVRAVNGTAKLTDAADATLTTDSASVSKWFQVTGTTQAAIAPGQVTGLTAVNASATAINLYWYDPEDTGGWDISGYVIQAHRHGKKFQTAPSVATIKATEFSATPPTLGGTGNEDNATWYQTKADAGVLQAAFTGIAAVDHDGNANTATQQVKWYFRVYAVTTDHGPDNQTSETFGDALNTDNVIRRSASPSNTASDTPAARDIDHDNDDSTTALDPLAAPGVTATTGTTAKERQIDLSVTVATELTDATPDVEQIAYRIDYSEGSGDNAGKSWKLLERDTRFTGFGPDRDYEDDDDLGFDETRSYRIFAIGMHPYNDVGISSTIATGATKASTVPDKPTGVMASSPSLRSIEASWTEPEDNGGQPITKYLVQWVLDDDDDVAEAADFTAGTPAADSTNDAMTMGTFMLSANLADDEVYVFRVAGVNELSGTERPDSATATGDFAPKWSDPVLFNTADAAKPKAVEGLTSEDATDRSGNSIPGVNLLWNKPSDKISITNYDIEVQDEEGDWANPEDGENSPATRTSYTDPSEPEADEVRKYRVRASNDAGHGPWEMVYYPRDPAADHMHVAATGSIEAQTLTAGMTETVNAAGGFTLNPAGVMVSYMASSDNDAVASASVAGSMVTITGVAAGTATITVEATAAGDMATQTITVNVIDVPGMPMNVVAAPDSRTQISVGWEAAAANGSAITGYIVEQSYMGSFLDGDDIHNTGAGGESFAFSNHMEWWETLNCKGMLLAVGSDETPVDEPAEGSDQAMYCKHYADTMPTDDMEFPAEKIIAKDSETDAKIEMYFNKRYKVTDAAMMTAAFMNLGPGREYMYRVKAANAVGPGMWSETATATTTANMAPMDADALTAEVTVGMDVEVQSTITDGDDDTLTWSVDHGEGTYATAAVDTATGMVTITGVMATMADMPATITVTATDQFGAAGTQDIMVTVEADNVPPTDGDDLTASVKASETVEVQSTISDSDEGDTLTWNTETTTTDDTVATATVDATTGMVTITGVAVGEATITVTATDMAGESATQDITVTVTKGTLMEPSAVMADHDQAAVTVTWGGGEHADTFTVALVRRNDDGTWDLSNTTYDQNVNGSPFSVAMGSRASGSYTVFVAAGQDNDDGSKSWTAWVTGVLDYQP